MLTNATEDLRLTKGTAISEVSFAKESKMQKNWNVQFKQQDCERVNLDRRKLDNSESCSEGRRVEREKSDLFKKFKATRHCYSMNDSGDFQDVESKFCGRLIVSRFQSTCNDSKFSLFAQPRQKIAP